jgi:hypothetical protein
MIFIASMRRSRQIARFSDAGRCDGVRPFYTPDACMGCHGKRASMARGRIA